MTRPLVAGASYTYDSATGVIVFTVPNGTSSLDASFSITAPAVVSGTLNFTATATATETNLSGGEPDTTNNTSSVIATTGIAATRILDGTITTNTPSDKKGAQEMILSFIDVKNPMDSFSQVFVRDAQGQQGAFLTDTGFDIDHSHDFYLTIDNPIDGHKVIITDLAAEGVVINGNGDGNIFLNHDDSSKDSEAIVDTINPGTSGGEHTYTYSTDDAPGNTGGPTDPSPTSPTWLYGGAKDDTIDVHTATASHFIDGGDGKDSITGGSGNDMIVFDANDTKEDGGAGYDILRVDQGAIANTEALGGGYNPNNYIDTVNLHGNTAIKNIEEILITEEATTSNGTIGGQDASKIGTTLVLQASDVINFTDSNHTLNIVGSAGDKLDLSGDAHNTWTQGVSILSPGGQQFDTYTAGNGAILHVDHDVQVITS